MDRTSIERPFELSDNYGQRKSTIESSLKKSFDFPIHGFNFVNLKIRKQSLKNQQDDGMKIKSAESHIRARKTSNASDLLHNRIEVPLNPRIKGPFKKSREIYDTTVRLKS